MNSRKWGIDVEGRKMQFAPWPVDSYGEYLKPVENEIEEIYGISGEAVNETLLYFEECGGDTEALIRLLNDHVKGNEYFVTREMLSDKTRWYNNEYYFYLIMFTKKIIGRYDFHFGENSDEQLSVYHKIYEKGFLSFDPFGEERKDVTNGIMYANIKYFGNKGFDYDFFFTLADSLIAHESTLNFKNDISSIEHSWYSSELQFYLYEFNKIILNLNSYRTIVDQCFDVYNLKRYSYLPDKMLMKSFELMMSKTTDTHKLTVSELGNNFLLFELQRTKVFNFGNYETSISFNVNNIFISCYKQIIHKLFNLTNVPVIENIQNIEKYNFSFQIKWIKNYRISRHVVFTLTNLLTVFLLITSYKLSLNLLNYSGIIVLTNLFIYFLLNSLDRGARNNHLENHLKIIVSDNELRQNELVSLSQTLLQERNSLEQKVTERTAELAEANEKLKELDRAKTDFFSNVSHELRTPLTLILSPVDEALKGRLPEPDTLEMMQRNGRHLLSLINDLLDISKISAGRMQLKLSETDLCTAVTRYCAEMESAADYQGIRIRCVLPESPVNIFADTEKLGHITANLFSNSLKFTSAGGEISISVEEDSENIKLKFSDTGTGIPSDRIETIFDRFSQADTGTTRNFEGTGIGLAVVKEYTELHGGTVSVISRHEGEFPENHGTVFTLTFPAGREHFKGREDVEFTGAGSYTGTMPFVRGVSSGESKIFETENDGSPKNFPDEQSTILIVEDNSDMSRLLQGLLSERYRTLQAPNGIEALTVLDENPEIDLVLSDIMMPEMDGHELLRRIRLDERFAGMPVLFLTARADDLMKLEGLELGAIDYVTKPFSSDELKLRIKNQMELRILRNNLERKNRELRDKLSQKINRKKAEVTENTEHKLEEVCRFIKENYRESLNREILASAADMNPDTFSRMFNSYTGCSLADYINRLRVDDAKRRLAESDLTVTRIYIESGFDSLRTFNRVFKKFTGQSPAEYREGAGLRN